MSDDNDLRKKAKALGLYGLVEHWETMGDQPWVPELIAVEEAERGRRSLQRRLRTAKIGRFKSMSDFDWSWPKQADRAAIEELFRLGFMKDGANVVLVGPNGTGKTMTAQNIGHEAVLAGHTVRFVTASAMLNDLGSQDGARGLQRALKRYCGPSLLLVDEVGYLSYDNRHADLLFEVVTHRYNNGKSIVVTTNKAFADWNDVFPNAACVVTLVDRLVHRSEIVHLDGDSYRLKEAQERAARKRAKRKKA